MSSSPETPKIKVVADSGFPTVVVTIMDCAYEPIVQGVGRLKVELQPGLYKVRYATGNDIVETVFELEAGQKVFTLPRPNLPISSPAPLTGSQSGASEKANLAVNLSIQPGVPHGVGSELFVFVREAAQEGKETTNAATPPPHPASGLKLFDFAGGLIEDFGTIATSYGCAGVNIALDPGSYVLRLEWPGHEALEQTIVTCAGWQTQVFLPLALLFTNETIQRPSLENAAIFMATIGQGFRADAREVARVEMARAWLARGEPVVPLAKIREEIAEAQEHRRHAANEDSLREMLQFQFTNPMLGIYAAHLMMITPYPDDVLLREVFGTLKILLADHPDVTSIGLWLDPTTPASPFLSPPMLRSSWSILVNRSRTDEKIVPTGSYTLRITGRLWGSGVWLVWVTPAPAPEMAVPAQPLADLQILSEYIRKQLSAKKTEKSAAQLVRQETVEKNLNSVESAVLNYVANVVQGEIVVSKLAETLETAGVFRLLRVIFGKIVPSDLKRRAHKLAEDSLLKDKVIQQLGIPQAALTEAAAGLFQKIGLK